MLERFLDMFRLDLRLLGIFRILLGALIIVDFIGRCFDLGTFYTDDGVLPRRVLLQENWHSWTFSLNMATGSIEGQAIIFGIAIFIALMVLIGYRTKLFLVLLYIFMVSIHARNPEIIHGGDTVLKLLVFYSIFLPVNVRYAVDKFQADTLPSSGRVLSVATIAYILQACYIYVFSAIAKSGIEWMDGSAVHYALGLEMFEKSLTPILRDMPAVMEFFTYYTWYFEKYGFLLLFIPFAWQYFRLVGVLLFMGLHFGFFLFLTLGNFPWAAMIMWFVILPPMVGAFIESHGKRLGIYDLLVSYRDKIRRFIEKPTLHLSVPTYHFRPLGWLPSGFLLTIAVGILLWNTGNNNIMNCPPVLKQLVRGTATWQSWAMFAPYPLKADGWYVMDAQLKNGEHIDILNDREEIIFTKPEKVSSTYKNERWRKYLVNRHSNGNKAYLLAWGSYYCSCWNEKHLNTPKELESFSIYFMKEVTPPPGKPLPRPLKTIKWNHWCKEEFKSRFK